MPAVPSPPHQAWTGSALLLCHWVSLCMYQWASSHCHNLQGPLLTITVVRFVQKPDLSWDPSESPCVALFLPITPGFWGQGFF